MGVHCSTRSSTKLVQEALCEPGVGFPEGKLCVWDLRLK